MVSRIAIAVYALVAYGLFLVSLVWAAAFLADISVPWAAGGHAAGPLFAAIADSLLLGLFAVQHTVMARSWFKERLTRLVPAAAERSTFVAAASVILLAVLWLWQPIDLTLWDVQPAGWRALILGVYGLGWAITVASTFMIDHFELFGLRQARDALLRRRAEPTPFKEAWLYAWVRHPMMLGLLIVFWATPRMTAGHLLFSALGTGYIFVGLTFEERDLRRQLGGVYAEYACRVPMLVPRLPAREAAAAEVLPAGENA